MSWLNILENSKFLTSVYSKEPSLSQVRLHEVFLHEDGPRLSLRFDFPEYPDRPTRDWIVRGYNRLQIVIVLVEISEVSIHKWHRDNIGSLVLRKTIEGVNVQFLGVSTQTIQCTAKNAVVERLSAYHRLP